MSEKDAEEGYRKYRQNIVWGSIAFLFGLLGVILLVLSIAGYIPPIPEDSGRPTPVDPDIFAISSVLIVVIGLYLMARGYKLRKFRARPPVKRAPQQLERLMYRKAEVTLKLPSLWR